MALVIPFAISSDYRVIGNEQFSKNEWPFLQSAAACLPPKGRMFETRNLRTVYFHARLRTSRGENPWRSLTFREK